MALRLARKDGCTLAEVEQRYSLDELAIWVAEWMLDPWGEERADLSRAIVGCAMVAPWSKEPMPPRDLMPDYDQPTGEDRQQLAKEQFAARVAAWNKHLEARGVNDR